VRSTKKEEKKYNQSDASKFGLFEDMKNWKM